MEGADKHEHTRVDRHSISDTEVWAGESETRLVKAKRLKAFLTEHGSAKGPVKSKKTRMDLGLRVGRELQGRFARSTSTRTCRSLAHAVPLFVLLMPENKDA